MAAPRACPPAARRQEGMAPRVCFSEALRNGYIVPCPVPMLLTAPLELLPSALLFWKELIVPPLTLKAVPFFVRLLFDARATAPPELETPLLLKLIVLFSRKPSVDDVVRVTPLLTLKTISESLIVALAFVCNAIPL